MTVWGDIYRHDGEPILAESVVLYADLLGVSQMARSSRAGEYLRIIEGSVREVVDEWEDRSEFEYATFSDSLLIAVPVVDDNYEVAIAAVLAAGSTLQAKMILKGILMRGGVTIGDFSSQKHLVFGEALVRAAKELEGTIAQYPRIIIDREHPYLKDALDQSGFAKPAAHLVLHDEDGWPFINYFEGGIDFGLMDETATTIFLKAHHDLLLEQLGKPGLDDRVRIKLEWAAKAEVAAWGRCRAAHLRSVALVLAGVVIPGNPHPSGHERWLEIVGPEAVGTLVRPEPPR